MSFIGDLFSGEAPKVSTKGVTKSFSTPAYNLKKGNLTMNPGAASPKGFGNIMGGLQSNQTDLMGMRSALNPIRSSLGGVSANLSDLYGQVRPGFGRLTDAKVKSIRDAAAASIGDLRTQMARRGVLGSSFAQDTETRTNLAFAQEEEKARSEAIIQEIGLSTEVIQKQLATQAMTLGVSEADRAILGQSLQNYIAQASTLGEQIKAELNQLQVAGNITNQVSGILMEGAMMQARIDLQQSLASQSFLGSIFGTVAGPALQEAGTGFGNIVKGLF